MLVHLKVSLLVNVYWFSLPIVGYGLLLGAKRLARNAKQRSAVVFMLEQPLLARLFLSFCVSAGLIAIFSIPAYTFRWPAGSVVVWYLMLFLAGGGYLGLLAIRSLFITKDWDLFQLKGQSALVKVVFGLLLAMLASDFVLSLYVGADMLLGADTYFHLSRIVSILAQGFNTQNGFYAGVPENAYHYNVIYSLYVIPAYLFRSFASVFPASVWQASLAFFRLLEWAAIFTLAWHVIIYWLKDKTKALLFATLTTLFAVVHYSAQFFVADYPNHTAYLWFILLIISLSYYEKDTRNHSILPALLAILLIGMTHSTYSLMSALWLGLVVLIKLISEQKFDKQAARTYGILLGLLLIAPLKTALYPTKFSTYQFYGLDAFPTTHVLGLTIKQPLVGFDVKMAILDALGLIGFSFLLYRVWATKQRYLILGLLLFFPIIVYNPPVLGILHAKLPYWVLMVFDTMNVLCLVSAPLGIYALGVGGRYVLQKRHRGLPVHTSRIAVLTATGLVLLLSIYTSTVRSVPQLVYRTENKRDYALAQDTYAGLRGKVMPGKTTVADDVFSYFLPAIVPTKVLAIEEGHSSPLADYKDRQACQQRILASFNYADLQAIKAQYVVLGRYDIGYAQQQKVVSSRPYLKKVGSTGSTIMYEVEPSHSMQVPSKPYQQCLSYQAVENNI